MERSVGGDGNPRRGNGLKVCESESPKRDRLIEQSEGGEAHRAVNNRNLANQLEFDFLDDVLSETA
jgi:hypothetical protein